MKLKKVVSNFIAVSVLIMTLSNFTLCSAKNVYATVNNIKYAFDVDAKTAYVSDASSLSENAFITSKVIYKGDEYTVKGIGSGAFENSGIASLSVPDTVEFVYGGAFRYCSNLTQITFASNSVKFLGDYAFEGCTSLSAINGIDNLEYIGLLAFKTTPYYTELLSGFGSNSVIYIGKCLYSVKDYTRSSLNVESGVLSISPEALKGNTYITSLSVSDSVKTIGKCAFYGCTGLSGVNLGSGVEKIDEYAFSKCSALTSITAPAALETIGAGAFEDCTSLASANMQPSSLSSLKDGVFSGCANLSTVSLPVSLKSIGAYSFMNCSGLDSLDIPSGVETIDYDAFRNCVNISAFDFPDTLNFVGSGAFYNTGWYNNYADDLVMAGNVLYECKNLLAESAVLGQNVVSISPYAFLGCSELKTAVIAAPVKSVGEYAFSECGKLSKIFVLSDKLSSYKAFEGLGSGTEVYYIDNGSDYSNIDKKTKITGLSVTTLPLKLNYGKDETVDMTGSIIKLLTENSSISLSAYDIPYTVESSFTKNGKNTVNIICGSLTTSFQVNVTGFPSVVGDINADGLIDAKDLIELRKYLAGISDIDVAAADVNFDNVVDAKDLVVLRKYIAGIITEF